MTLPNSYAGKMHTVLCRKYKTSLNLEHLQERMYESGDLEKHTELDKKLFRELMYKRIDGLDVAGAISEVSPFIKDKSGFDFWSKDYFKLLTDKMIFEK